MCGGGGKECAEGLRGKVGRAEEGGLEGGGMEGEERRRAEGSITASVRAQG